MHLNTFSDLKKTDPFIAEVYGKSSKFIKIETIVDENGNRFNALNLEDGCVYRFSEMSTVNKVELNHKGF